jgi:hypothetical protein
MSSRRRGDLNLIDELTPAPSRPGEASVPSAPQATKETKAPKAPASKPGGRVVVKIPAHTADQARAAVVWLQSHGHPSMTLTGYVEGALQARLERDKTELHGGEDFPPVEAQLRRGRRIGG